jgi:hypothetical protein
VDATRRMVSYLNFAHHTSYNLEAAKKPCPSSPTPIMSYRGGQKFSRGFRRGSNSRYSGGGKRGGKSNVAYGIDRPAPVREDDGSAAAEKFEEVRIQDEIDEKCGFWRFDSGKAAGEKRIGWLVNMHQVCMTPNE